ncbi:hypothetical protein [Streptomyces sp. NPDC002402]
MRTLAHGAVVLTLISGGAVAAAQPSYAACAPEKPIFNITNIQTTYRPTNIKSDFIKGPGTISYSKADSATSTWTGSAGIGGDIGVIVAKLNLQASGSYAKSWTKTTTWTYTLDIAKGKTQRIRMYHASKSLYVTKKVFNNGRCKWETVYKDKKVIVPSKQNVNLWKRENF